MRQITFTALVLLFLSAALTAPAQENKTAAQKPPAKVTTDGEKPKNKVEKMMAVVEASCKPEDIGHRVSLLGGADVLAITGITDTVSPAAILRLNLPVGRIGPTPATPATWADLIMERLER